MFKKLRLKSSIKKNIHQIEELEKKRYRSQSALVEAILKHETPSDEDVEYFNKYTAEIDKLRREIRSMKKEIESL
ncbi:MAG TPA: hypothetical protein PLT91_01805 [Clostridia bacterium]|jgi:SMC interacting uncharacterized protein involved in chromosome segregation|nr:MAG: hypothetical protein BWX97_01989 [Firmicutes bacterium ADurb.Bin146]HOD93984.1 hypothetical protein [Clostridia bacterium]HQM38959.1 hypothetical protein [Clostridia bacterium]